MERVSTYVSLWEERCYYDGIPDSVPSLLEKTGRAPSYKAIAICILNNDLKLNGLGFKNESKKWADDIYWEKRRVDENEKCGQLDLLD